MKNDKKKNTKQLLIVSSLLIVIGIALTITGIWTSNWIPMPLPQIL